MPHRDFKRARPVADFGRDRVITDIGYPKFTEAKLTAYRRQYHQIRQASQQSAAGAGSNPRTNEPIKIRAAKVPKFRAGKALKDALN